MGGCICHSKYRQHDESSNNQPPHNVNRPEIVAATTTTAITVAGTAEAAQQQQPYPCFCDGASITEAADKTVKSIASTKTATHCDPAITNVVSQQENGSAHTTTHSAAASETLPTTSTTPAAAAAAEVAATTAVTAPPVKQGCPLNRNAVASSNGSGAANSASASGNSSSAAPTSSTSASASATAAAYTSYSYYVPPTGKNKRLKKDVFKYFKCDRRINESQLQAKRDEFWDTAPAFDGKMEIWSALRAAVDACEARNYQLAQAIIDSANIILPNGLLNDCYDELGNRYQLPIYVLARPINMTTSNSTKTPPTMAATSGISATNCRAPTKAAAANNGASASGEQQQQHPVAPDDESSMSSSSSSTSSSKEPFTAAAKTSSSSKSAKKTNKNNKKQKENEKEKERESGGRSSNKYDDAASDEIIDDDYDIHYFNATEYDHDMEEYNDDLYEFDADFDDENIYRHHNVSSSKMAAAAAAAKKKKEKEKQKQKEKEKDKQQKQLKTGGAARKLFGGSFSKTSTTVATKTNSKESAACAVTANTKVPTHDEQTSTGAATAAAVNAVSAVAVSAPAAKTTQNKNFQIKVRISGLADENSDVKVSVNPTQTVLALKTQLRDLLHIETDNQRMFFGGKVLKDREKLKAHHIHRNVLVQVILRQQDAALVESIRSHMLKHRERMKQEQQQEKQEKQEQKELKEQRQLQQQQKQKQQQLQLQQVSQNYSNSDKQLPLTEANEESATSQVVSTQEAAATRSAENKSLLITKEISILAQ